MSLDISAWNPDDLETARAVMRHPSLAPQFDIMTGPGELERALADPFCDPGMRFLARRSGEAVGCALAYVVPGIGHPWSMLRLGVVGPERRRGTGSSMLSHQIARLASHHAGCREACMSAWEPCDDGAAFAARHGFELARHYWLMERPKDALPELRWPAGIVTRAFDGSVRALADWNDVHNASFARHYHFVPSTTETCRAVADAPGSDPTALLLAYDGDRCVGFCRNERRAVAGEVGMLGVAPEARGRGLGRALLRWGVRWLAERAALPITLLVDGENEGALALYRSESFRVVRTRRNWSRPINAT